MSPDKDKESHHHGTLLQLFTNDTVKDMKKDKNVISPLCFNRLEIEQIEDKDLMDEI